MILSKHICKLLHDCITIVYYQGSSWKETWEKLSHFSLFQAQGEVVLHRIYRKNIPKDFSNHFSSNLQKTVQNSPCFKSVGIPLYYARIYHAFFRLIQKSCAVSSLLLYEIKKMGILVSYPLKPVMWTNCIII